MDNESDAVMMLMELGAYENMLDRSSGIEKLTEEELLEKINRDVAVWRAYNDKERIQTYDETLASAPNKEKPMVMEKGKDINVSATEDNTVTINRYPNINAQQEQTTSDIIAEEEEEKFYLEPIE